MKNMKKLMLGLALAGASVGMKAGMVDDAVASLAVAAEQFPEYKDLLNALREQLDKGTATLGQLVGYQAKLVQSGNAKLIAQANSFMVGRNPATFLNELRDRRASRGA
jgi:hypothetical protein